MSYKAPLDDMNFLLNQVFNVEKSLGEIDNFAEFDSNLYGAILEEAAKFSENVLFPLNRTGDEEGCLFEDGKVTTPKGFKEAYQEFCQAGWQGSNGDPEFGGQGLPKALHVLVEEMIYSANTSFCLYPSLTNGAYHAIHAHASDDLKQTYLPPMLEGRWAGAMGLTEPHAGSDLGIIKSKAEDNGDGTFKINGTKIFITGGEHDLSENIIHLVLAKLPGAPDGPKGISLFLVPKIKVNADGSLGEANQVTCGSIEHKMGIKASSTCVMNFDNSEGYLVGKENRGLFAMFTMMNLERLSIGIQGIGLGETSYQLAKAYAEERKQGKNASGETATIIQHADVRRMLMQQRANTEPGRALAVFMGMQIDKQYFHSDENVRNQSAGIMALLTPIAKAFFTDKGYEACNHGVQVLGGHGFVREWGLEQLIRDAKIAQIYEGTNGIQAQDLLVRKVCLDKAGLLEHLAELIKQDLALDSCSELASKYKTQLESSLVEFTDTATWLKQEFAARSYEVQGGAVDFLHAAGYLVYGWMWLKMVAALESSEDSVLKARKLAAAQYYLEHQFGSLSLHCEKVKTGYRALMSLDNETI
ncbi:MAG: acyl-CoA dehydrogenase [Kangiellaceae bacterium]|nr:acyl-CoA dehydrogenase [Kangiellaceae bacterium]